MTPLRYHVQLDAALERGDAVAACAAADGAALWHRPPEEWELERARQVETRSWETRSWNITLLNGSFLRVGDLVEINGVRSDAQDAAALAAQINSFPTLRVSRVEANSIWVEPRRFGWPAITVSQPTKRTARADSGPPPRSRVPAHVWRNRRRMDGRRR